MLNIPEYKEYGGETKIALMDNSSLAFMHELSQRSYPSDGILSVYDLVLIPKWVIESVRSFGIAAVRAVILVLFLECYRHWRIQSGVPCGSL